MPKYAKTYLPFRPGATLMARIKAHADRVGITVSEAVRQLCAERLTQIYGAQEHD